jgi:hypothetical protein
VVKDKVNNRSPLLEGIKKVSRVLGIAMAMPFFIWVVLGLIPSIPSIVDVFGIDGLKIPTSIVIAGLMLAAIGYEDF